MILHNHVEPVEKSYNLNMTQTEVDFIVALMSHVRDADVKGKVLDMWETLVKLDTDMFHVEIDDTKTIRVQWDSE